MIPRKRKGSPGACGALPLSEVERALSELRLASGGLRGYWLVDNRSGSTLASKTLVPEEMGSLERILAAMPEIFQAGVSMEMLGAHESEPPLEFAEILLVGDERIASALAEPRGRFGMAAILAPTANIALELMELRSALRSIERL